MKTLALAATTLALAAALATAAAPARGGPGVVHQGTSPNGLTLNGPGLVVQGRSTAGEEVGAIPDALRVRAVGLIGNGVLLVSAAGHSTATPEARSRSPQPAATETGLRHSRNSAETQARYVGSR